MLLAFNACGSDGDDAALGPPAASVQPSVGRTIPLSDTHTESTPEAPRWESNGQEWANLGGPPPECPGDMVPPVDLTLATGLLYPGQIRGDDYKAHGGFRFDGLGAYEVQVVSPIDLTP